VLTGGITLTLNGDNKKEVDTKPLHILLLENQGVVRAGFKALLKETVPTAEIYEAAEYAQAIAILSCATIDFAFLDFNLAGDDAETGLDVLHYIRAQALITRAVMLSIYDDEATVMQCLQAGAFGYISKAMDGDNLLGEALATVLENRVFLPASVIGASGETMVASKTPESVGIRGRAVDVLYYLCQGYSNQEIADRLCLAENTVRKDYVSSLLKSFKVKSRTQLLIEIARQGIIIPKPGQGD
jgi:two-component system nitrate/nitrite response regulator NarL